MRTTNSTILYSDTVTKDWMRKVCDVIIANGGDFSINTFYKENWFMEFEICWPHNLDPEKTLGPVKVDNLAEE